MKSWITNLAEMEKLLRKDLKRLNDISGDDENSELLRSLLRKMIALRVKGIELTFRDYLCGRNNYEKDLMEYQIRIGLPVFSHLQRVLSISSFTEDSSISYANSYAENSSSDSGELRKSECKN